ncbi:unnamed protein product [Heligmosomoides polygyrus]|uniref:Phlebovirus_G2 domain-containing protein n=1 Tax=Heligmosomoides polygyrus TaxID=6339 RepID=A0A183GA86_HELPZ|nr:unnamed protein product [Heligmosomoides polygyrus]
MQLTLVDAHQGTSTVIDHLVPNVPVKWKIFTLTLSSITVPPLPMLHTSFISDGKNTAVWDGRINLALRCDTKGDARNMSCTVMDYCFCLPAETKANCRCEDGNITESFNDLHNRLPVVYLFGTLRRSQSGSVHASVTTMTTSEIIVSVEDD